ncbi:hypothetical protein GCM10007860_06480 [Chitiniphilus shinanonensis]|uniref:DUF4376 domain-containing protein n=1 Tax=Chitiniphilus shinanonensis TaxID=553088 RepID=A0ABQ6BUL9_9NEIS|nr:DUF4376 domain-containing protein [Chitiniphilus shinanonensis]GLS03504.1 hypothetical protein GCM10007860_06480 [Chitiniphilus shinanonensis]
MDMFYAASTSGFYDPSIHQRIPPDAVEITHAEYEALYAGVASGFDIEIDSMGRPVLVAPQPLPVEDLRAAASAQLPAWEAAERTASIEHAGRRWLTTPEALQDIRDALLAGLVPGGVWIDAAREPVPMTLAELQALWAACVTRGAAIYQRRLMMEAEIAAMDAGQLVTFAPNWPA